MKEGSRLPAVSGPKLPDTVAVTVTARAQRARFFSSDVDVDVVNGSPSPLICDIRGRSAGREIQLEPGYVWIDPHTTGTLHVRVGMRIPGIQSVVVRMRDAAREYLSETSVQTPIALRLLPLFAVCVVLALAALIFSGVLFPKIEALTAPSRVIAGDLVEAEYATAGSRTVQYSVRSGSAIVSSGTLTRPAGTIRFATSPAGGTYTIEVSVAGVAGAAIAKRIVVAQTPPPRPLSAAIHELDVQPAVATSGTPMKVRYSANGQSGTIRLLDNSGTPWNAAPYDPRGSVTMVAPHVDAPQHFTIQMQIRNGASTAQATTGLVVLPSPTPSPSAAPTSAPPPALGSIVTTPSYVVSGTYFAVTLRGAKDVSGRATLQNAAGTPLQSQQLGPGKAARFIAPGVKRATTFLIAVNATSGKAGQLMVVPLVIHPR